jgi:hypothetical protein
VEVVCAGQPGLVNDSAPQDRAEPEGCLGHGGVFAFYIAVAFAAHVHRDTSEDPGHLTEVLEQINDSICKSDVLYVS